MRKQRVVRILRVVVSKAHTPMTRDNVPNFTIRDSKEFEAVLTAVVENAVKAGVDVRGAWEFETRGSTHNWEVEIIELAKDFEDEDGVS